jgi:hypothetical protein
MKMFIGIRYELFSIRREFSENRLTYILFIQLKYVLPVIFKFIEPAFVTFDIKFSSSGSV